MLVRNAHRWKRSNFTQIFDHPLWTIPVRRVNTTRHCCREWRPSYIHMPGHRPLQYDTIGHCLERAANQWPDKPYLVSHSEELTMTFSQLLQEADKLAAGLMELGMQRGDKLGICSPNSMRWVTTMMASTRAGFVAVPINPAYQTKELEFCLNKVGIKALVIPSTFKNQDYYGMLRSMAPEMASCSSGELISSRIPSVKSIIMMDDKKLEGVLPYREILCRGNSSSVQMVSTNQNLVHADSGFTILFTSGTTGKPKAALLTHFTYVNNSWEVGYRNELAEKEHRICLQIPLYHAFGLLTAMAALQHGSTMIIPSSSYNIQQTVEAIAQENCTVLTGTPTMYVDLVNYQRSKGGLFEYPGAPIRGLELAVTGGAPCSGQLAEQIRDYLGVRSIKSIFGMTEACSIFQSVEEDGILKAADTVGKIMGYSEVKIVDAEGKIVPMGSPGELCVRSYANMQEYYGDPHKTGDVLSDDNWLKTGDQFILQEDGYGKISGRLKDIIIRGGENIFPKEIEDFLNTHPDIIETHVFGIKDDRLGEEICASVRLREGAVFEYNKMKKFCQGTIAHFKVPRHLKIVDKFPVTPSGKIQKFKLREMVESGQL